MRRHLSTNSIPFCHKVVFNGNLKYKIDWLTCYKLRPYVHDRWGSCLSCAAVCRSTKPDAWWRNLDVWSTCTRPPGPRWCARFEWIDYELLVWRVSVHALAQFRLRHQFRIEPVPVAGCNASHEGRGYLQTVVGT